MNMGLLQKQYPNVQIGLKHDGKGWRTRVTGAENRLSTTTKNIPTYNQLAVLCQLASQNPFTSPYGGENHV